MLLELLRESSEKQVSDSSQEQSNYFNDMTLESIEDSMAHLVDVVSDMAEMLEAFLQGRTDNIKEVTT